MRYHRAVTASTNLDARAGRPGDVFTADFQTAGRGRLAHVWQSAKAENLTFSMVLAGGGKTCAEIATLPLVVGLAIAKTLKAKIKWPNDILVDGRKLCGILCERAGDDVIAGVGVNVNQTQFPAAFAAHATSLARLAGHSWDREALLQRLVAAVWAEHARWLADGFAALHPDFAAYDFLAGRTVTILATDDDVAPLVGRCAGIQRDGALLVGGVPVYAGEAHVHSF